MRPLTLTEYETAYGVALDVEERDKLVELAGIQVTPSRGRTGYYDLRPGSWIGAIELPTLSVTIWPKLLTGRVLFLLSYALDSRVKWAQDFDFKTESALVEAVVPGFLFQVKRAISRGLLQGYRPEEDALMTVRGRLRLADQIRDRYGLVPPIEVRYDEFTEDIEENRLVKAALARLGRLRLRSEDSRRKLRVFDKALENVRLVDYDPRHLPKVTHTRLNEHYRPALALAELILRATSYELQHDQVRSAAFLVDMNWVFETFVVVALREALQLSEREFPSHAAGRPLALDRAGRIALKPDISWWQGRRCLFVGDVKYKSVGDDKVRHADLYQLLAYTVATGLPGGLLIYAAGEGEPATHEVVHLGKRLEVVTLDLSGPPDALLRQIKQVAERIRALSVVESRPSLAYQLEYP